MIFVTIGTNEQAFQRLVDAAAELGGDEQVIVQYGAAHVDPVPPGWRDFMSFTEMAEMMEQARCVVAHAGVGSILLAHRSGKRPIVMPRRHKLGEAVDDHQVSLAQRLQAQGLVTVVEDLAGLRLALATAEHPLEIATAGGPAGLLASELRQYLVGNVQLRPAPRPQPAVAVDVAPLPAPVVTAAIDVTAVDVAAVDVAAGDVAAMPPTTIPVAVDAALELKVLPDEIDVSTTSTHA